MSLRAEPPSKRWLYVIDGPGDLVPEAPGVVAIFPLTDDPATLDILAKKYGDRLVPSGERIQRAMVDLRDDLTHWCGAIARPAGNEDDGVFAALNNNGSGVNGWWFTLLAERNPGKTNAFLKIAQCAAVQSLLGELDAEGIGVSVHDPVTAEALAALGRRRGLLVWNKGGRARAAVRLPTSRGHTRSVARAIKWGFRVLLKFAAARFQLGSSPAGGAVDATLVTYFPFVDFPAAVEGQFRNTFAPEWQTLFENQKETVEWLLITVPHAGMSFYDALRLVGRFRGAGVRLVLWEEFATPRTLWRAFCHWWRTAHAVPGSRIRFLAEQATARGPLPEAGPILAELYSQSVWGVDGFSGWVYHQAFRDYFGHRSPGRVFYFAEMQGWERALASSLSAPRDGKLFAYQHAAVGTNELNYYIAPWENRPPAPCPDVMVVNGAVTENLFRQGGHPHVVRAEALRHLTLGPKLRAPVNANREPFALALSGIDWREARSLMAWLCWGVARGFRTRWIVRLHPSIDRERVLWGWPTELLRAIDLDSASSAHDALEKARVAVAGSTSMALDALALGCRVVVPVFAGGLSLNPLLEEKDLRDIVDSPAALHKAVAERLNTPFDPAAAARGRAFVEKYWELDDRLPRWKSLLFGGTSHG